MLEFGDDHKVKMASISSEEAIVYLEFLHHQLDRHDHEANNASLMIDELNTGVKLWGSELKRHRDKGVACSDLIGKIRERFGIS